MQVAGGEPRRLTFNDQWTLGLAWTPDGREIVFSSDPGGSSNRSLWRISSLGGMAELLSGTGGNATFPAISRQGSRLIYSRRTLDSNIWGLELSGLTTARNRPARLIASTRRISSLRFPPTETESLLNPIDPEVRRSGYATGTAAERCS